MDIQTLEALGISKADLLEKVVDKVAADILLDSYVDDGGDYGNRDTTFAKAMKRMVVERIKALVAKEAEERVLPSVVALVEQAVMVKTNRYGDKVAEPRTFREYIAEQVVEWMGEKVDPQGKVQADYHYGDQFKSAGTRVQQLVRAEVGKSLDPIIKEQTELIHKQIQDAILMTVGDKLRAVVAALEAKK